MKSSATPAQFETPDTALQTRLLPAAPRHSGTCRLISRIPTGGPTIIAVLIAGAVFASQGSAPAKSSSPAPMLASHAPSVHHAAIAAPAAAPRD